MFIKNIKIQNFRNYKKQNIDLGEQINIFYGDNAQGKTNILESIFVTSIGKSFRAKKDKELIKLKEEKATIEVEYKKIDREGKIKVEIAEEKNIYLNDIKQKKLSDFLGTINIVMFGPDDIEILKGGPEQRRRFLNVMISQLRPKYVYILNMYIKALKQRNNYLRQIKFENKPKEMLEIWDEKLTEYAEYIYNYRKEFIEKIIEKIEPIHEKITEKKEKIKIDYISDFKNKEDFKNELRQSWDIDIQKGHTTKGIQRDDFSIKLNEKKVNVYGSQGQNRTVVLSLKLSELQVIKDEIGEEPILLLDDFMSELDEKRRVNFLKNINYSQVLITSTHEFTIEQKMCKTFHVENGNVEKQN